MAVCDTERGVVLCDFVVWESKAAVCASNVHEEEKVLIWGARGRFSAFIDFGEDLSYRARRDGRES